VVGEDRIIAIDIAYSLQVALPGVGKRCCIGAAMLRELLEARC
jgi:hypothetical protein